MHLKDFLLFREQCYVDGTWVQADSGVTDEINDPATGETIGTVPWMGAAETRRAIAAANAAWPAASNSPASAAKGPSTESKTSSRSSTC